jgi:hypothetical protein
MSFLIFVVFDIRVNRAAHGLFRRARVHSTLGEIKLAR